ncbi:MAG: hypothetical protein PHI90_02225 [Clostridia bacterium]|nr:hypothetical protein [Clostridia bacterium]MDD4047640.1 hypothetical protein [Clostridia bacterium]
MYQKYIYTNPLEDAIEKVAGIGEFEVEKSKNQLLVSVRFATNNSLRSNFYLLLKELEIPKMGSSNEMTIQINNISDTELERFLKNAKLPIYEAICTGYFTTLPAHLNILSQQEELEYDLEIDNQFIFINASKNDKFAHMIINREQISFNIINMVGDEYI